jgi:AraC-like DNA-binding protein
MFTYKELYVSESLSFFINKIWVLETSGTKDLDGNKTLVPNGCFNIAFITGQGVTAKWGKDVIDLNKGIYFCGQATQSVDIEILPGTKVNMVQIFPWTVSMFTDFNMKLCRNKIIPINYINKDFEREAKEINHSDENHIMDFLDNRLKSFLIKKEHSLLVHKSCVIIMKTMGQCSIKDLSSQLGCSSRHLQILFLKYIGLSPKEFSIIIKLRNAIDGIAFPSASKCRSMTCLALDNDFYDQAHFNNTFKTIVKTLPGKFTPSGFILAFKKKN